MEEENKQKKELKKKPKEKKTLQENLKDPVYVNYNLLTKLEEIKRINYSMLQVLNGLYELAQPEEEEKEGTFKNTN